MAHSGALVVPGDVGRFINCLVVAATVLGVTNCEELAWKKCVGGCLLPETRLRWVDLLALDRLSKVSKQVNGFAFKQLL